MINGGFGLLLDGSAEADAKAGAMLNWDVSNGVARRSWSGNANAQQAIRKTMERVEGLKVTLPEAVSEEVLAAVEV